MSKDSLLRIFNLCYAMDTMAGRVYGEMSSLVEDKELSGYWRGMAAAEESHMVFWQRIIALTKKDMISDIFDESDKVIEDLEYNFERAKVLEKLLVPGMSAKICFAIAFRLEYYLLYPVFESFFTYVRELRPIAEVMEPNGAYESHIKGLIAALGKFCGDLPEMELLSDTLKTLWLENRRLATTIYSDSLTGLMNRRGFFSAAEPFMDLARRDDKNIGLILADLDNFKKYNLARGHETGDALLKHIGLALRQVVRSSDLVARFSGEEFAVLFYALDTGRLMDVADKIRKTIKGCRYDGEGCTVSVGAASLESIGPGGGPCCINLEEVLSQATRNLEGAKDQGGDTIIVS